MLEANPDIVLAGAIKSFLEKESDLKEIETKSISPSGIENWNNRK